jgi:hypothetical protein
MAGCFLCPQGSFINELWDSSVLGGGSKYYARRIALQNTSAKKKSDEGYSIYQGILTGGRDAYDQESVWYI